jgi:hypothetical protein
MFCHPERFGKFYVGPGETKPSPKHANGKNARFKDTFNFVRLCRTLEATRAVEDGIGWYHFYVNRPDAMWWLLMLDIDLHGDRDDGGESDASELGLLIVEREFGDKWERVWTATSRNGRGFYIYFLVANPARLRGTEHMDVEDFAERLRSYNKYLKAVYNDVAHQFNGETRRFKATVDAVKGSPYHLDWNRYVRASKDDSYWENFGDLSKPQLPPEQIDNRGTLATMPLTGIRAGDDAKDVMHGKEVVERFVEFCRDYKNKAFPPSFFFSKLPPVPISSSVEVLGEEEEDNHATHGTPKAVNLEKVVAERDVPISCSVERRGGENEAIYGDDLERMNQCASRLVNRLGRPPTKAEVLTEYHLLHLNTGADHDHNRDRLASTAAGWWAENFSPCRLGGFNMGCHVPLVKEHLTSEVKATIRKKNRSVYTDEQAAVVLYCIERSALTRNKKVKMQFTCGNNSIVGTFNTLGIELVENPKSVGKKLAAIKQALVLSGLVEELDGGRWYVGKSKCYGLGPWHPAHKQYTEFFQMLVAERPKPQRAMSVAVPEAA